MLIKLKNKKGFTMLELSFVLLVLTVVLSAIINFFMLGSLIAVDEKDTYTEKLRLNSVSISLFEDLYSIKSLHVENLGVVEGEGEGEDEDEYGDSDVILYETQKGELIGYKFKIDSLYQILDNKEIFIANGKKLNESERSVYIEDGLLVFNYYFNKSNILWDFKFRPRLIEVSDFEE